LILEGLLMIVDNVWEDIDEAMGEGGGDELR
jgi:hypothetical protein